MRFRVLGQVDVVRDGAALPLGGPQQRRLLALFLVDRGRVVSIDRIVDALWPDGEAPRGASRSAMKYVSRLRVVLGDEVIATNGAGYRLDVGCCDVDEFESLVDIAGRELPEAAVDSLDAALALWHGPPFGEFGGEWWALAEATRLAEFRVGAEIARVAALMEAGLHNRALPDVERLCVEYPLDERPVRLLMQGLVAIGRQAEAMRAGTTFRRHLAETTGLEPSAGLTQLEISIAAGTPPPPTSLERPLRGYTIHHAVGEGAHGRVYVATQPGTERRVAIKAIRPGLADTAEFIRRFDAEARLVARLEHPHVVPLYDYWREPGHAYLVFRLLSGGTARDAVVSGGPWSLARVSTLVEEIAGALMFAHAAGVVHNDVKASNVLLDADGVSYLTDFGIAMAGADCERGLEADVVGLGLLAWELLSGSPARSTGWSCPGPEFPDGVLSLVGRMPSVPDGLDAVVRRAASGGYPSVAELLLAWRAAVGAIDGQLSPIPSDVRRTAARELEAVVTAGANPYCGLRPFDAGDAARFHGRNGVVDALTGLVETQRFVTVVGASGSGKSSVVLAGLVPRLLAEDAIVVTMLPGEAPLDALHTRLREVATVADAIGGDHTADTLADVARRAGRLVVVVDQFEECWTRATAQGRDAFLDVAAAAVGDETIDVRFVTTVRADLLDRPLAHRTIGALVGAGSYVLGPLSPADLEAAIVQPAADAGVTFDEGVVADLVAATAGAPGSLPMLQFTLTELYDRRRGMRVCRAALEDVGGIAGAIGRRAEDVYAALDWSAHDDLRALFERLVTPGQGVPDTRRRARVSEFSPGMKAVADEFVTARLLVADRDPATREPTVEIAHEALLTNWTRLVGWLDGARTWLAQLQHLVSAARAWDDSGRPDAELYRGSRLEAAIEAIEVDGRAVSAVEREFVDAGRRARDVEVGRARRTADRLRRLLVVAVGALVVALVAGALALVQRRQADDNADAAQAQAVRAEAAATEAQIEALVGRTESLRPIQRDVAALLAVEAYRLADTPRTRSALLATFTDQAGFYDARRLDGDRGVTGIVMPDGASAYVVDDDTGRLRPYDLDTGAVGDPGPVVGDGSAGSTFLAASADGRWLAQLWRSTDGTSEVGVFDTRAGTLTFPPLELDGTVVSAAFSGASDLVMALDTEARVLVIDRATGEVRGSAPGVIVPALDGNVASEPASGRARPLRQPAGAVADGDVFVGAADGSLRVFDASTWELDRTLTMLPDTLESIHPLSDGTLLTTGRLGITRVDSDDGEVVWVRPQGVAGIDDGASGATCAHLAVIERRGTFYCGNAYGRLAEHDLGSGYSIRLLDAQNGNSGSVWPSRGGTELVAFADTEPVVSRWRLDGSGPITHLLTAGHRAWAFSPTGDRVSLERGGVWDLHPVLVVDVESSEVVRTIDGFINADWLDDDTLIGAIVRDDGSVETAHVDLPDGDVVPDGVVPERIPSRAEKEPGKERMLVVYVDGADAELNRYDPRTQIIGPTIPIDGYESSAISRSGHRIAAGTARGVEIYDGATGERVGTISGRDLHGVHITVADQLFVSSLGGELTQYDLTTLQQIRSFGGSRGYITVVRGNADGTLIATLGGDHRVILYDVATGVRVGTPITIPEIQHNWLNVSLDGRWLAMGGEANEGQEATQIWNLDPARWVDAACRLAGRNLTRDEWASFIGELAPYRATCPELPHDT